MSRENQRLPVVFIGHGSPMNVVQTNHFTRSLAGMMSYSQSAEPYPWAVAFEDQVKRCVLEKKHKPLISYRQIGQSARLSIPTRDHYLPMLYTLALQEEDETVSIHYDGIHHGSISMLCFSLGL